MAGFARLGRRGFTRGEVTARAAGNARVTSDVRGPRAGFPRFTPGIPPNPPEPQTTPQQQSSRFSYAGRRFRHGRLIVRDRHVIERTGHTTTSPKRQQPASGVPNPEADGPPRPAGEMVNRTISWQIGTDHTRFADNTAFHASVTRKTGRRFPLSTQGSTPRQPVYGGTPGLYRPYGARGGGVVGPAPRITSTPGGPYPSGVIVTAGSPQDGPQSVFGGYPHGLHSPTYPAQKQTQARYRSTPQQRPGRLTRPANSKRAGQSMSQFIVPQSGSGGGPPPSAPGGRQAGVTGRFVKRSSK